ncbi:hypothetical protein ACJX0J_039155, partial [Zea mays]
GTRHQNEGNQESKRPRESQSTRRGTRELGIVKRARGDELLRFMDGASKEPLRKHCRSSHYSLIYTSWDLKVAKEEQDIGFYAGFVGATYFLGRAISAMPWGMFADKYGRKPCIVISILSVIVFNTLFGLSTTYWMAIVTRGLLGLLCGILGPIKAYASEVCRKEHQALGISLVTSSRAIALVIGPAIGGFLAQVSIIPSLLCNIVASSRIMYCMHLASDRIGNIPIFLHIQWGLGDALHGKHSHFHHQR